MEVHEDADSRWMQYAGDGPIQSLLERTHPERLVLPYTRAMAASLLFMHEPRSVLVLGLGGGALPRFLLHHFRGLQMTVIEHDPGVVDAAKRYFGFPPPRASVRTVVADARDVSACTGQCYDLVLVDLFRAHGMPDWVCGDVFLRHCRTLLTACGVLVLNTWLDDASRLEAVSARLAALFPAGTVWVPVNGYRNLVLFAFADTPATLRLSTLYTRARRAGDHLGLDLTGTLNDIEGCNRVERGVLVP